MYASEPLLSNIFYAVKLRTNNSKSLKSLCLWLNTTWGLMTILANREETEILFPSIIKVSLGPLVRCDEDGFPDDLLPGPLLGIFHDAHLGTRIMGGGFSHLLKGQVGTVLGVEYLDQQVEDKLLHSLDHAGPDFPGLGQEDIFTVAMIQNQLKNTDKQFDALLESGIPEDSRVYLGMMGFRVVIDIHGEVLEINQPGIADEGGE